MSIVPYIGTILKWRNINVEHAVYLKGIKNSLRANDINYADLAEKLRMTESGVKKMLNAKDISFRRVLQICEVLGILPGQLFAASEESVIPTLHLSEKQEEALINNRYLLMTYWLFTIEKRSLEEIAITNRLTSGELNKLLHKLLNLDLVIQRRGKFLPKHRGKFRWPDDSKIVRMLNQEWSQLTLKRALRAKGTKNHRLVAMKLSKESYDKFLDRLSNLFDETVQTSEREELVLPRKKLFDVTALFAAVTEGVFPSADQEP